MKLFYVEAQMRNEAGELVKEMMAFNKLSDAEWNFNLMKNAKGVSKVVLGTLEKHGVIRTANGKDR